MAWQGDLQIVDTQIVSETLEPHEPIQFEVTLRNNSFESKSIPSTGTDESAAYILIPEDVRPENTEWDGDYRPFFQFNVVEVGKGAKLPFGHLLDNGAEQTWTLDIPTHPHPAGTLSGNVNLNYMPEFKTVFLVNPNGIPAESVSAEDIHAEKYVVSVTDNGKPIEVLEVLLRIPLQLSVDPYVRHLLDVNPEEHRDRPQREIAILLWGFMGTGKTSFLNTTLSVLHGVLYNQPHVVNWGIARSDEVSVTRKVTLWNRAYQLDKEKKQIDGSGKPVDERIKITLVDTWGAEKTKIQYPPFVMTPLLEGRLPSGFTLPDDGWFGADGTQVWSDNPALYKPVYKPGAIFMFITNRGAKEGYILDQLKAAYEAVGRMDGTPVVPIVILTGIDTVDPQLRYEVNIASKTVVDLMTEISTATGVPMNSIVPMCNYTVEHQRHFAIDRAVYVALRKAFNNK